MELLKKTAAEIKNIDRSLADQAQKKLDNLTKPQGSLGRLEEMAKRIVEISGSISPTLKHKAIFTMAGDHGVVEEGVSAYPKEVTLQMVHNFLSGGAGINVLAKHVGARVVVVDVGVACDMPPKQGLVIKKVGYGTKNMAKGPAM
ncbi:MAG: nicotinate-nucleotide--dimethylbenzimidazole phosphoribosyltransferase, partial [Candidatus Omnitrophota bacterium]